MSDWRMMDHDELNREIAQRLGWRIEMRIEINGYRAEEHNWYAVNKHETNRPEGYHISWIGRKDDENKAWDECFSLSDDHISLIPAYSRDANTQLPLSEGEVFEIQELWNGTGIARVVRTVTGKEYSWEKGANIAEAKARAWLAYKDAN